MNKPTFSKVITIFCFLLFLLCIGYCLFVGTNPNLNETLIITLLSSTGSLAVTCILGYIHKSERENIIKHNMTMYASLTDNRLRYEKGVLELMKEYEVTREEIDEIDENGDADSFVENAMNRAINESESFTNNAHNLTEKTDLI